MVVDGKRASSDCCFDYGNAETSGKRRRKRNDGSRILGHRRRLGRIRSGETVRGSPQILKTECSKGNAGYWQYGNTHKTPWPTAQSVIANYATAMLKGLRTTPLRSKPRRSERQARHHVGQRAPHAQL